MDYKQLIGKILTSYTIERYKPEVYYMKRSILIDIAESHSKLSFWIDCCNVQDISNSCDKKNRHSFCIKNSGVQELIENKIYLYHYLSNYYTGSEISYNRDNAKKMINYYTID